MPDTRFHSGPALHPAPQTFRCSATTPFIDMNLNLSCVPMAAVANAHKNMLRTFCNSFYLLERIF
jgi:hypothetical protein